MSKATPTDNDADDASTASNSSALLDLKNLVHAEVAPSKTVVIVWALFVAELGFDLVTTMMAFWSNRGDMDCCGHMVYTGPLPLTMAVPFFFLIVAEITFLIRAIMLTLWPSVYETSRIEAHGNDKEQKMGFKDRRNGMSVELGLTRTCSESNASGGDSDSTFPDLDATQSKQESTRNSGRPKAMRKDRHRVGWQQVHFPAASRGKKRPRSKQEKKIGSGRSKVILKDPYRDGWQQVHFPSNCSGKTASRGKKPITKKIDVGSRELKKKALRDEQEHRKSTKNKEKIYSNSAAHSNAETQSNPNQITTATNEDAEFVESLEPKKKATHNNSNSDVVKRFCCGFLKWNSRVVLNILNLMTLANPFFGCVIAFILLYTSDKTESFVVLGIESVSIVLHFVSVRMEGGLRTRQSKCLHSIVFVPFLVTIVLVLLFLREGGMCYTVEKQMFGFSGCEVCPDTLEPPIDGLCGNSTLAGTGLFGDVNIGSLQDLKHLKDIAQRGAEQGSYCSADANFCFFEF